MLKTEENGYFSGSSGYRVAPKENIIRGSNESSNGTFNKFPKSTLNDDGNFSGTSLMAKQMWGSYTTDDGLIYLQVPGGYSSSQATSIRLLLYPQGQTPNTVGNLTGYIRDSGFINASNEYIGVTFTLPAQNTEYNFVWMAYIGSAWEARWVPVKGARYLTSPYSLQTEKPNKPVAASNSMGVIFEITRDDGVIAEPFRTYSYAARQLFLNACIQVNEDTKWRGDLINPYPVRKFVQQTVTFSTTFDFGYNQSNVNTIVQVLNELSTMTGRNFTYIGDNMSANVVIRVGTMQSLFNSGPNSDFIQMGHWSHYAPGGPIQYGNVEVATDGADFSSFAGICREEIAQCLGAGNDWKTRDTVFCEFPYPTKGANGYYPVDKEVMKILYSPDMPVGETFSKVGDMLCVPYYYGRYIQAGVPFGFALSNLSQNVPYKWRAFSVEYDYNYNIGHPFSPYTAWQYFTSYSRSAYFDWTYAGKDTSGNLVLGKQKQAMGYYVGATEWTNLQNNINALLGVKGMNQYSVFPWYNGDGSFTTANSGGVFYYYHFNQVCNAIRELNPPTAPPSNKSSGVTITAYDMNLLMDSINSIS
ncbi:DUF2927 domain-containing protein [Paenibacillus sp. FSL H7-0331]